MNTYAEIFYLEPQLFDTQTELSEDSKFHVFDISYFASCIFQLVILVEDVNTLGKHLPLFLYHKGAIFYYISEIAEFEMIPNIPLLHM